MTLEEKVREIARLDYKMFAKEGEQRLDIEIRIVEMVFKALTLANGGALVALFSLVGALGGKSSQFVFAPRILWLSFTGFAIGLGGTLVAGVLIYYSQRFFSEATWAQAWIAQANAVGQTPNDEWAATIKTAIKVGNYFILAATFAVIVALIGFFSGSALALSSVLPSH